MSNLTIEWIDAGQEAKCPADPNLPNGCHIDLAQGKQPSCYIELPYPAPRCGVWEVTCQRCLRTTIVTAAGRPDDPRSFRIDCLRPGTLPGLPAGGVQ